LAEAFLQQSHPAPQQNSAPSSASAQRPNPTAADVHKLRAEIAHLDLLIKKLQTELQIERQYNQALELHVRTLTELD
jgi:hypothetical protein